MARSTVLVFCGCLGVAGCYSPTPLPAYAPEQLPSRAADHGIVVGAESVYTDAKAEEVLGEGDVIEAFMPVLVALRNETHGLVMLDIGATQLVSADGKVTSPMSAGDAYRVQKMDPNGGQAFGLTGMVVDAKVAERNSEMFNDWNSKELTSYMIGGGESRSGLLFFAKNQGKPPYSVVLAFENRVTGEKVKFRLRML